MNVSRLRHTESSVYASATRSGSRVFQASSAAWTFVSAVSRVKGGNGGRAGTGTSHRSTETHVDYYGNQVQMTLTSSIFIRAKPPSLTTTNRSTTSLGPPVHEILNGRQLKMS